MANMQPKRGTVKREPVFKDMQENGCPARELLNQIYMQPHQFRYGKDSGGSRVAYCIYCLTEYWV